MTVVLCLAAAGTASALNTTKVVSGNGQVLGPSHLQAQPMVVQVTNASGAPQSNVTVTWTITSGNGFFLATGTNSATSVTDTNGQATIFYTPQFAQQTNAFTPFVQTTISASADPNGASPVTFTLTQLVQNPTFGTLPQVQAQVLSIPDNLQGAAGTTGS